MFIDKAEIVEILRRRGLDDRADWVDRQLSPLVDVERNASLLRMLDIDPSTMSPVQAPSHQV